MQRSSFPWALLAVCLAVGCSSSDPDVFHVESDGARLPVVAAGPREATRLILFQHGGPNGFSDVGSLAPGFERLAQDTLFVSWGQRGTTHAAGYSSKASNTIAQYVMDMRRVRAALEARYPGRELWLLGHSWGVPLTLSYLTTVGEQGVAGTVLVDGFHSYVPSVGNSMRTITAIAQRRIQEGREPQYWQEALDFAQGALADGPPYTREEVLLASDYCARIEDEEAPEVSRVPSPYNFSSTSTPVLVPDGFIVEMNLGTIFGELERLDLSEGVARLRGRKLLIWGQYDCRVPVESGQALLQALGSTDKRLVVMDGVTHVPQQQSPEQFARIVREFIAP